ncbi:RNA-binding protein 28 [Diabrotica undecimpunctata]|uniref:RNA-binding protein 28 n=1 Tax=Diabrotica undecimpunctata TaxID=50387 RepID=UPI003B639498
MAGHGKKKTPLSKEEVKEKLLAKKKESKQLLKEKRARLVVKNLSFKVTPEKLKKYFEKYGDVKSVELLKKPDGKLTGCAFVQFTLVQKATKARHYTNDQEFLGRKILVDFAKAKNKYQKEQQLKKVEIKNEDGTKEIIEIKEEEDDDVSVKNENLEDQVIKDESENSDSDSEKSDKEDVNSDEEDNDIKEEKPLESARKPYLSHDVSEGKTVFVKNVPFDATNDDLKQCMRQFGHIYYALVCIDKLTEHSKGTAFVKFVNAEDAQKALSAGTELKLLGNILDCHPALDKGDVNKKVTQEKESKNVPKDSRNLYLVKEGVILAGSKAAEGVSATDMAKRLQIEQYKTQMLRNLNMFVSKERIVIHNLPSSWDDQKLKLLFQKYSGPGAIIREARIMRDMKNIDSNGLGKSKEYGFVTFSKHENALMALRNLNNNPEIFSTNKRPIITFSIENKSIIKARQKRLDKSKQYNPVSKSFNPEEKTKVFQNGGKISRKDFNKRPRIENAQTQEEDIPKFGGVATKPGTKEKMRSRYKLNVQAKLHHENLKKEKKRKKNAKKSLAEKKKEFTKQPKQKINKVSEKDNFSKMVSDYKKKLVSVSGSKKSKWYE